MASQPNAVFERVYFDNISASTDGFVLRGGFYGVTVTATWGGGSVTLQRLSGDGSTYVTALTAFSANAFSTVHIPPGTYKFAVATASAVYVDMTAIAHAA